MGSIRRRVLKVYPLPTGKNMYRLSPSISAMSYNGSSKA
jgi:hypothetical protein